MWYLNYIMVAEVIVLFESFKNCAKIVRWFFFLQWSNLSVHRSTEAVAAHIYWELLWWNCMNLAFKEEAVFSILLLITIATSSEIRLSTILPCQYIKQLKNYNHGLYSEGLRMMLSLMVMCYVTLPLFRWGPNSIFRRHRICSLSRILSWSSKLMTTCPCRKDNGHSILFS